MSQAELDRAVEMLRELSQPQQRAAVEFIEALSHQLRLPSTDSSSGSALRQKGKLLVHTGVPLRPMEDSVNQDREERIQSLIRQALEG
jgi:hypothetical protein